MVSFFLLRKGDRISSRLLKQENVRKRLSLKDNPLMIALTQRLWVTAVQTDDQKLHFDDYEIYMLRLHRLILPEFDLAQSQELILEDWTRDSSGNDHLDYGFFHSSMFELVGEAYYRSDGRIIQL